MKQGWPHAQGAPNLGGSHWKRCNHNLVTVQDLPVCLKTPMQAALLTTLKWAINWIELGLKASARGPVRLLSNPTSITSRLHLFCKLSLKAPVASSVKWRLIVSFS